MPPVPRPTPPKNPAHPTPRLRLKIQDVSHPGAQRFLSHVPTASLLQDAVTHVLSLLYPSSTITLATATIHHPAALTPVPWTPTRSITLVLASFQGVAYTHGTALDDDHKEIHLSTNYIEGIRPDTPERLADEIVGVVVHEMVHCWQHNARGTCPGGLIEGIADWVRLRAGYAPPHWKREAKGTWDQGYQTTAWFLEWLEEQERGSVGKVNAALKGGEYNEDRFWKGLFGKKVEALWEEYGEWLKRKDDGESGAGMGPSERSRGKIEEGQAREVEVARLLRQLAEDLNFGSNIAGSGASR